MRGAGAQRHRLGALRGHPITNVHPFTPDLVGEFVRTHDPSCHVTGMNTVRICKGGG
jgi:hypothetical protein